ncbi:MAG: hypothetical protein M0R03_16385 [Novosphingobium sp.]|nr:hypothetical protein [Novosphingobium sp.]
MKHKELKKRFNALESDVKEALENMVNKSKHISKHMSCKALKVYLFDYTELVIVNDELTFLDSNGQHHSLYSDCSLEDLIDILNNWK